MIAYGWWKILENVQVTGFTFALGKGVEFVCANLCVHY